MDRRLTYKERWFLYYNETFDDWFDRMEANGDFIIPSCTLESIWDEEGISKFESELEKYNKKKNDSSDDKFVGGVYLKLINKKWKF